MKVLVIGAGMYVTGRDGSGEGTILAALTQGAKKFAIDEVVVVARSHDDGNAVKSAARRIGALLDSSLECSYQAIDEKRALADQLRLDSFMCAVVCVPDHAHFLYASELMERGVPTLVVKPLTPTLVESLELEKIQKRTGTYCAVEYHKRWDESNRLARQYIADGKFGQLVYATVEYSQRISMPSVVFRSWASKTNIFQYLGCHYVDLIHYLTGFQPTRAMAYGTKVILCQEGVDTYDSVHAQIVWNKPDGGHFFSQLAISWIDPERTTALSDQKLVLVGEAARMDLDQKNRGISFVNDAGVSSLNPYFGQFLPDVAGRPQFGGYGCQSILAFLADAIGLKSGIVGIESLQSIRPSIPATMATSYVLEAVNRSLVNNSTWVAIDDLP